MARRQSLVSWIRKNIVVTDGRQQGRRIVLEKWQRLLLQRIDREKRVITAIRSASQIGKTTLCVPIALRAAIDGAGVLLASSTETNIRDMARRLDGVLEAAPDLAAHFPSARSGPGARASWKDRRTKGLGWLGFASAGSASQLAARTVQVAVADEVARFPRRVRSGEGSPMQLLRARLLDWGTDAKLIAISSPTLPTDTISTMFSDGDQNRLEYRCPSCGSRTPLRWGQVAGVEQGEQPGIACLSCGVLHSERTRRAMLPSAVWVSQKRDRVDERIASYTAGRLDSARASLTEIVLEWRAARLDAERGNPAAMLGCRNTICGEPGDLGVADVDLLLENRERRFDLGAVEQVCAGVDVQDDRLVYQVLGFAAADTELWALDGGEVLGDPRDDAVWIALHGILQGTFGGLPVSCVCVDSGHLATQVRAQCSRRRWWVAVKGQGGEGVPIVRGIARSGAAPVGKNNSSAFWSGRVSSGKVHFGMNLDRRTMTELAAAQSLVAGSTGALTWEPIPGRQDHRWDSARYAIAARNFRRLTRATRPIRLVAV